VDALRPSGRQAGDDIASTPRRFVVTGEAWALAASCFFAGLAAGFLGGLCTILRPMQAAMTGPAFRSFMESFLRYAGNGLGKMYNLAWSLGMFLLPILALVLLRDDIGTTSFVLTTIGLVIVFVGVIVVSNAWKTPTYKVILSWEPCDCARELGGGTAALLHDQLTSTRHDLGSIRALSGGRDLPVAGRHRVGVCWPFAAATPRTATRIRQEMDQCNQPCTAFTSGVTSIRSGRPGSTT